MRDAADGRARRAREWITTRRATSLPVDLSIGFYERDRDSFAAMLGSAIALRLFLFLIPTMLLVVGALGTLLGPDGIQGLVDATGVSGTIAKQLSDASESAHRASWAMLVIGVVLTPWAGRSLTLVLAACSAGAWRIRADRAKISMRSVSTVTALLVLTVATTFVLNQVREVSGVVVPTMSLAADAFVLGLAWFAVTWSLPRGTQDPGALLPGAMLVGAAMGALQWFMQFYLPDRVSRSSEVMGTLGVSVALLGYLFLVGRLMAASLVLDAVVFERLGSISEAIFGLPGLRRLPQRSARLAHFFDLDGPSTTDSERDDQRCAGADEEDVDQ